MHHTNRTVHITAIVTPAVDALVEMRNGPLDPPRGISSEDSSAMSESLIIIIIIMLYT